MLQDTKLWKQMIKAKLTEHVSHPDPVESRIQLSPNLKIRSRATQSAYKYATLNGTI